MITFAHCPLQAGSQLPSMELSMDGCGRTKGCYRNPKGCSEVACDVALTWRDLGETILFELSADTDGWVAVGFSEDKKMVCMPPGHFHSQVFDPQNQGIDADKQLFSNPV